ncbi:outer membrane protein, OmpA/MotB family [Candidatus Koribacter versatilis Ellin345]|uniref:Outer membrane protein, OmpA/MotB family n=1 Tax=Koribacter versatilis (strain Ellin345) TaxID=204669 RepID=Q1ILY1_KORVE|nr:OmpA family protein [Candidatus Koribacter versatilis]ABF42119.1 outer membrane protein, OmpA/MotB family [Candidatus Koribacter versatilis Ellin345]
MNRISMVAVLIAGVMPFTVGCATKKYTREQAAPIINKTNELDDLTAKNSRDIKDTDRRAQSGIADAQAKATTADQHAVQAGQQADAANKNATQVNGQVASLAGTVENLDNYKPVAESSVHFGFDKADLTKKAKDALDQLGGQFSSTKHFIIEVEGSTDSTGDADYNYQLSKRRADAVIQYLADKYQIPAHKIYLIGLGKDKPVEKNATSEGRAKNRRVDVRLMTNTGDQQQNASANTPQGGK